MAPRLLPRWSTLALALVLAPALGCAEPATVLSLSLWQPERFSDGLDRDYVEDAEQVAMTFVVDGETAVDRVVDNTDDALIPALELEREVSTVSAQLTFVHPGAPDAIAATGPITLVRGQRHEAGALLAPPLLAHTLDEALPPPRDGAAVCVGADGEVFIAGGAAAAPVSETLRVDARARGVEPGPSLPAGFVDGACAAQGETVWALFGCDDAGDAPALLRSVGGADFAALTPAPDGVGCGPDVAVDASGLWLSLGDRVERRSLDGALVFAVDLPQPRHDGRLIIVDGGVLVVGGHTLGAASPTPGVTRVGDDETVTTVGSLEVTAAGNGLLWADSVYVVDDDGEATLLFDRGALGLDDGFSVGAISWFGSDGVALLSHDGVRLQLSDRGTNTPLELPVAHPDARLLPDPSGAVRITGGASAGVLAVLPAPSGL